MPAAGVAQEGLVTLCPQEWLSDQSGVLALTSKVGFRPGKIGKFAGRKASTVPATRLCWCPEEADWLRTVGLACPEVQEVSVRGVGRAGRKRRV